MNPLHIPGLAMMTNKVTPREIEKLADRLDITPADNLGAASYDEVRIAAVQLMLKRYSSLADYVVDMNLYIADAVNRRAQLICFPAYTGMLPFLFLPQVSDALLKLRPLEKTGLPDIRLLNDMLADLSDYCFDAYFNTMSVLAARHGVYIMAGSALCFEDDDLCHRAFLINDTGDLVGYQDKISRNRLELELQVRPASELKLFETPVGQLCILTGEDADYYEPARVAKNLGAQILICPTVFAEEPTPVDLALGINMRAQENHIYGLQSVLVGDTGFGFAAEGTSCIFAPNELLSHKNGIFAQSSGRFEPDIVCGVLNYDKLISIESPHTQDRNSELMQKYIDRLY